MEWLKQGMIKIAMRRQDHKNDCIILSTLEDLVPQDHLVGKIDASIDFSFIEDEVEDLYNKYGRPSMPPKVLFKLIFINMTKYQDLQLHQFTN